MLYSKQIPKLTNLNSVRMSLLKVIEITLPKNPSDQFGLLTGQIWYLGLSVKQIKVITLELLV